MRNFQNIQSQFWRIWDFNTKGFYITSPAFLGVVLTNVIRRELFFVCFSTVMLELKFLRAWGLINHNTLGNYQGHWKISKTGTTTTNIKHMCTFEFLRTQYIFRAQFFQPHTFPLSQWPAMLIGYHRGQEPLSISRNEMIAESVQFSVVMRPAEYRLM